MRLRLASARSVLAFALFAAALVAPGGSARAALYDVPILVDDENDLRDLLEEGEISQDEFEQLLRMLERPLDLNRSRREALFDLPGLTWPMVESIVSYRTQQPFRAVDDLEVVGVPREVIRQLRPFAKVAKRLERPPVVKGSLQVRAIEQFEDGRTPAVSLRARTELFDSIDIGVTGLLQDRTGPFSWHHADGLTWVTAGGPSYSFRVPKFYAMIEEPGWAVIVGSYQIGFGEKLVFDETTRSDPDGFYPDDLLPEYEETGKFGISERLYGVAATLKELPLGEGAGALDATIWASYWPYDIFQNDVDSYLRSVDDTAFLNSSGGPNPLLCHSDVSPELCANQDTDLRRGRHSFQTLRAAFTELLVGARVAYLPTPQWKVGLTGYWAMIDWLESGEDLYFAPSAGWPNRDMFGAYGVDVEGHVSVVSIFAEYARTFAGSNALGGRVVLGWKRFDVELNGRWYQTGYDNPHARGSAASDEFRGMRDRDEAGGGVRVTFRPLKWFDGRVDLDVWYRPRFDYGALDLSSRFNFTPLDWLIVSTGVDYRDKVLSRGGRDEDYYDRATVVSIVEPYEREVELFDERVIGAGARVAVWFQVRTEPVDDLDIVLFYRSILWDEEVSQNAFYYPEPLRTDLHRYYRLNFAHDFYTWLRIGYQPFDLLEVSARVKYLDEETEYDVRGDTFVEAWLQARLTLVNPALSFRIRYRVRHYMDDDILRITQDRETGDEIEYAGDFGITNVYHQQVAETEHLVKAMVEWRF